MYKKYLAEFIGTFALAFIATAISSVGGPAGFGAVLVAITLGLFVYIVGPISGCHINPAVTLAQLSVRKIQAKDALFYILVQFLGAILAFLVAGMVIPYLNSIPPMPDVVSGTKGLWQMRVLFAEMFGTFFFGLGIASVVFGKVKEQAAGLVIGGSLLLGALVAFFAGAVGFLNPAVALIATYGNASLIAIYSVAPVLGMAAGFQVYKFLATEKEIFN